MKKLLLSLTLLFSPSVLAESSPACIERNVSTPTVLPNIVEKTGTVCVYFPRDDVANPREFLIKDPSGARYYIHIDGDSISPYFDNISQKTQLQIDLNSLQGWRWINGEKFRKPVFEKVGRYQLYFADNLETEPENTYFHLLELIVRS